MELADSGSYWDLPYDGYNYSYVDIALEHGYHTLAYDRLGIGMSSHGEPKNEIQAFLEIETLAQMTKMAQNGSLSGISQKPGKIVHVGHSFGSSQTYAMTAKYPSISDGIVLTGFSMNSTFLPYFEAGANFQQAQLGTKSCQDNNSVSIHLQNYQLGYLTNGNIEANQYLFFYPPQFDVGILYFAEKARQPVTIGELLTLPSVPKMTSFKGPVLVIDGSNDLPYCGGDCSNTGGTAPSIPEMAKKSSPNASAFEAYLQPSTGHAINLHYNATGAYKFIINFLEAHSL